MPVIPGNVLAPVLPDELDHGIRHLTLDIETCHGSPEVIKAAQKRWKPPSNIKDEEKIKKAREVAYKRIVERSALLDGSPIGAVCFITGATSGRIFYWVKPKKAFKKIPGADAIVTKSKTEKQMLEAIRLWLDEVAISRTVVIGHNIFGFDLPRLRAAYIRHRIPFPMLFVPEAREIGVQIYDTMTNFRKFSAERSNERYTTLDEVLDRFDIPSHMGHVDGSQIPELFKKGEVKLVVTKCYLDTLGTYRAFLLMTNQAGA